MANISLEKETCLHLDFTTRKKKPMYGNTDSHPGLHSHTQYIHSAADTPACHSSEQCVFGDLVRHNREIHFPIVFLREWSVQANHERWSD